MHIQRVIAIIIIFRNIYTALDIVQISIVIDVYIIQDKLSEVIVREKRIIDFDRRSSVVNDRSRIVHHQTTVKVNQIAGSGINIKLTVNRYPIRECMVIA